MIHDTRGNVAVIVAIVLPVLLLFLALAADIGTMHILRAQLQSAADAGSLAGTIFTEEEVYFSDIKEPGAVKWAGAMPTHLKMYVELDPDLAEQRAQSMTESNIANMSVNAYVTNVEYYLPREKHHGDGKVFFWAELVEVEGLPGEYEPNGIAEFDYMESENADSYIVELTAEIQTVLLGSLVSAVNKDFDTLTVSVYSRGSFNEDTVFQVLND